VELDEIRTVSVKALCAGLLRNCTIMHQYKASECGYWMKVEIDAVPSKEVTAPDAFECLCQIREHLRVYDTILLCNGARRDAYPSRMSREMGGGFRIYVETMGQPSRQEDLVRLFDEAPLDKIGSVEEQLNSHRAWIRSLSGA
jgi:hypothetical protein